MHVTYRFLEIRVTVKIMTSQKPVLADFPH